ncbi:hypothetical protein CPB83DRAFT_904956 [Crepidotus variabilis]|uniref:G domain-containing protein n=1 Tax=Crepidotus variabilis TaxID=179855 RepID=A0A9P6JSI2_9AGAR|nr:hypothetical protein CPB83DRAFT_904956 [Crepidotus variabilis]
MKKQYAAKENNSKSNKGHVNPAANGSRHNRPFEPSPPINYSRWAQMTKVVEEISEDRVTNDQIIFFLMGPTGSGKSSFIHKATAEHYNGVSHSLKRSNGTQTIRTIKLSTSGSGSVAKDVIFVDTPGFDGEGEGVSPENVLKMISSWLTTVHKNGVTVDYLLYFADITTPTSGTPVNNLHIFERVCGEDCYNKVTLVASRCAEGELSYETAFMTISCALIARGAHFHRFFDTEDSAFGIIKDMFGRPNKGLPLLLQSELAKGTKWSNTQAGMHLAQVFPKAHKTSEARWTEALKRATIRELKEGEVSENQIIFAVLGPTGAGKSTFISKATGKYEDGIGHGLHPFTNKVRAIKFSMPEICDYDLVFIDTPGFDDSNDSAPAEQVLDMISSWLNNTYKRGVHLDYLFYFHPISAPMSESPLKNLRIFEKICGPCYDKVSLITTMWEEHAEEGEGYEEQLKNKYWKGMIEAGCQVRRFHDDELSAFDIIRPFINKANKGSALLLQEEVTRLQKELHETEAGKFLFKDLRHLVQQRQRTLDKLRKELQNPELDDVQLQEAQQQFNKLTVDLIRISKEMELLDRLGVRFKSIVITWKAKHGFRMNRQFRKRTK